MFSPFNWFWYFLYLIFCIFNKKLGICLLRSHKNTFLYIWWIFCYDIAFFYFQNHNFSTIFPFMIFLLPSVSRMGPLYIFNSLCAKVFNLIFNSNYFFFIGCFNLRILSISGITYGMKSGKMNSPVHLLDYFRPNIGIIVIWSVFTFKTTSLMISS